MRTERNLKIANVLISESWGDVTPEALERGIGGREGALLYLSQQWARQGFEVTNFVNVNESSRFEEGYEKNDVFIEGKPYYSPGFHEYVPLNITKSMLSNFPWDVVIAWECPSVFDDLKIKDNVKLKLCEMQVCHLSDKEMIAANNNLDYICTLSEWHKQFMLHSGLNLEKERVLVFPNGISLKRYEKETILPKMMKKLGKAPKFVYSSSPDRGLWYFLQIWPFIREEYPEAELSVCYGLENWVNSVKWAHARIGEMALGIIDLINQPGVKNLGKIGQNELSKLQIQADAWIYPFDPMSPTESGCITAIENAAAGNVLITTNADCMEDEFGKFSRIIELPFVPEEFAEKTIDTLNDEDLCEYLRLMGRQFAEKRDWQVISKQWTKFFLDQNLVT